MGCALTDFAGRSAQLLRTTKFRHRFSSAATNQQASGLATFSTPYPQAHLTVSQP